MKTNLSFWRLLPLSILLLLVTVSLHAQIPTNGLIAYYPFNGNANDASGNNFNGTVVGATLTTDRFGNANSAYAFNGTSNYISIADNNTLDIGTNDYSLVAWIKTSVTGQERIISKGSTNCTTGYMIRTHGTNVWVENAVQPSCTFFGGGTKIINNNIWHCVTAVVTRNSTIQIYVDGVLDKTFNSNTASSNFSNALDLRIGTNENPNSFPEWFNGSIDDIRMYNRALTSTEVVSIYKEPDYKSCRYQDSLSLVAFYRATNGQNWTPKDTIIGGVRKISPWNLNQPMTSWYGIGLNVSGCVDCIDLDGDATVCYAWGTPIDMNLNGNFPTALCRLSELTRLSLRGNKNMTGTLPDSIQFLKKLQFLYLDECNFTAPINPQLWSLPTLFQLTLDKNPLNTNLPTTIVNMRKIDGFIAQDAGLIGSIPTEVGQLTTLKSFNVCGNKFTGVAPATLANLKLHVLTLCENNLDSLPDLSAGDYRNYGRGEWGNGYFGVSYNNFTFDDILPNMRFATVGNGFVFDYAPQSQFFKDTTIYVRIGDPLSIDLKIDGALTSNRYVWTKNGAWFRELGDTIRYNRLDIPNVQTAHAGVYEVSVTNPNAPLLTLKSRKITVVVNPIQYTVISARLLNQQDTGRYDNGQSNRECFSTSDDLITMITTSVPAGTYQWRVRIHKPDGSFYDSWEYPQPALTTSGGNFVWVWAFGNFSNKIGTYKVEFMINRNNSGYETLTTRNFGVQVPCRCNDSLQLVSLYNATNGANWRIKTNWLTTNPINTWYGVTLNTEGCVIELKLVGDSLRGTLIDLNLPNLKALDLTDNKLTGQIPNFTGLPNLSEIDLDYNLLNGRIPNFDKLPNLKYMDFRHNQLSNEIPDFSKVNNLVNVDLSINALNGNIPNFNLPLLQNLNLDSNQLSGVIPDFTLPSLQSLSLQLNKLSGEIPNFNLPNLTLLALRNNQLTGPIPNFILPKLKILSLRNNQLSGSLPSIQNLVELRQVYLGNNKLSGCFPTEWQRLCQFKFNPNPPSQLDSSYNFIGNALLPWQGDFQRFCNNEAQIGATCDDNNTLTTNDKIQANCACRGIDTTSCSYLDSLVLVDFYKAMTPSAWKIKDTIIDGKHKRSPWILTEPMENWYGVCLFNGCVIGLDFDGGATTCLGDYSGKDSGLKGQLPASFYNLSELKVLYLSGNSGITGQLPNAIGRLKKLTNFHFDFTGINGALPDSLWTLTEMDGLSFNRCNIGAALPESIGNFSKMRYFIANECNWTGNLPQNIANLRSMSYFQVANNPNLTGRLPQNIGNMSALVYFNLGGNKISGSIPNTIGQLTNLETLILGGNQIDGTIPVEIGNCRNLKGLYLSDNRTLTGAIPSAIGGLRRLRSIWLQGNNLIDEIPASFGSLDSLEDLVLSRNKLKGKVPATFNQLKVKRLHLDNNLLDSVPLLTNLPLADSITIDGQKQPAGLWLFNNKATFDDIEQNKQFIAAKFFYNPQDSIFQEITLTKNVGETATINLGIDGALTTNKYVWFKKQGNTWVRFDSSNVNTLILRGVSACDAGDYKCEVTNPAAPLLTLKSRTIKIVVNGALSSNRLDTAICYGQTYRLPDNQTVSATTSFRDTVKNIRQCDSLIRIVNLTVSPKPDSTVQNAAICFGKTYALPNGQIVAPSVNTVYRDTILLNGCPSRFRVTNLTVNALPTPIVNDTAICSGNSARLWIRNNAPNFRNYQWQTNSATTAFATYTPSVTSTFFVTVTDANGCIGTDSARITVNSKPTAQITNLNSLYCKDNSTVTLQGQPTGGTFRLDGNSALNFNTNAVGIGTHNLNYIYRDANNCADTATQTFRLADIARNTINRTICSGDTITINQKKYHKNKLTGIDTLSHASKDGCDSILTVQIAVYPKIRASDDSTSIGQDKTETTINVLTNDIYPTNMIDVNIINKPRIGSIEEKGTGLFNIQMPRAANGFITFNYEICQLGCPNDCDTAMVKVFIKNANPQDIISTAITPNGDGNNDVLDFPEIDWVKYPNARMEIFNRWGQFVFVDDRYKGKWGGLNQNGQELMTGDYFFILQLIIVGGPIMMGSVYLQR